MAGRPANDPGIAAWVGASLRIHRLANTLTMDDVAEKLNVSKSTVKRWEHDENSPNADQVIKIARMFGVPAKAFSKMPRLVY